VRRTARCRVCGCTERRACEGGCAWATPEQDLCTSCAYDPRQLELALGLAAEIRHTSRAALDRVRELERELRALERRQHERDGHVPHARPYRRGDPTE
jgi:hypothetical protein